jgi:hypothetical protein
VDRREQAAQGRRQRLAEGEAVKTKRMKIRLALRHEGNFYNAYLAMADTMKNAKLIGSIAFGAVQKDRSIRDDFQALMQRVMEIGIVDVTGKMPDDWIIEPAPESEKAGHS